MTREWFTLCINCGSEFGYSDSSFKLGIKLGLSRPTHCPDCQSLKTDESRNTELGGESLGKSKPSKQVHRVQERFPNYDFSAFGITNYQIVEFFELMLLRAELYGGVRPE
jgi:hypothetical protein